MPVVCAGTDTALSGRTDERQHHDATHHSTGHDTPPMDHADATRRSRPASKPYSRNVSATRALSMGVLV